MLQPEFVGSVWWWYCMLTELCLELVLNEQRWLNKEGWSASCMWKCPARICVQSLPRLPHPVQSSPISINNGQSVVFMDHIMILAWGTYSVKVWLHSRKPCVKHVRQVLSRWISRHIIRFIDDVCYIHHLRTNHTHCLVIAYAMSAHTFSLSWSANCCWWRCHSTRWYHTPHESTPSHKQHLPSSEAGSNMKSCKCHTSQLVISGGRSQRAFFS